jgi:hypothetical protein
MNEQIIANRIPHRKPGQRDSEDHCAARRRLTSACGVMLLPCELWQRPWGREGSCFYLLTRVVIGVCAHNKPSVQLAMSTGIFIRS